MKNVICRTRSRMVIGIVAFSRDTRGQDAFEYLLASGTVAVVFAAAFLAFAEVIPAVVGFACPAIDTVSPVAVGACINS